MIRHYIVIYCIFGIIYRSDKYNVENSTRFIVHDKDDELTKSVTIGGGWFDYTEDVEVGDYVSIVCSLDVKYANDASFYMTINGMRANNPPDQKFNGKIF